jgi:hypothetical protein
MDADLKTTATYYVNFFYCNAMIFQFSYFAIILKDRLNLIHDKISTKRILTNVEVDLVIELYEKLIKILDSVNGNCTTQLVPIFGYILMGVTFSFYGFVAIAASESTFSYSNLIFVFAWFIEHAGWIF